MSPRGTLATRRRACCSPERLRSFRLARCADCGWLRPCPVSGSAWFSSPGALVVVAVGWTVQDQYLRDRYADGGMPELSDAAYLAVRDVTGARIAVAG